MRTGRQWKSAKQITFLATILKMVGNRFWIRISVFGDFGGKCRFSSYCCILLLDNAQVKTWTERSYNQCSALQQTCYLHTNFTLHYRSGCQETGHPEVDTGSMGRPVQNTLPGWALRPMQHIGYLMTSSTYTLRHVHMDYFKHQFHFVKQTPRIYKQCGMETSCRWT